MGNNPFQEIIDALIAAIQAAVGNGGSGIAIPPTDPLFYGILFLVLVLLLFEHRKLLLLLYLLLAYLMFGTSGMAVAGLFWIVLYPVNLAFDLFGGDRRFS